MLPPNPSQKEATWEQWDFLL